MTSKEVPKTPIEPAEDPALPEVDRLAAWVRAKLAKEEFDEGAIGKAVAGARSWCESGRPALYYAQAIQAADDAAALNPAGYARVILRKMAVEWDAGRPVEAPAECGFRSDDRLRREAAPPPAVYMPVQVDPIDRERWSRRSPRPKIDRPIGAAERSRIAWLYEMPAGAKEAVS